MKKLLIVSLLAGSFAAQAAVEPPPATPAGQPVTVNGKTYYKQGEQAKVQPRAAFGLSARSSGGGNGAVALKRGDVLQSPRAQLPATVSGGVLVQLAAAKDEADVARDYGLSVRFRTQSVVVYQAPANAELLSLQQRLAGDKRVRQVQLELARNDAQAQ